MSDEVAGVGCGLGQLWAELDPGPKSKVEAHELLYNIYLGAMVIGVVD